MFLFCIWCVLQVVSCISDNFSFDYNDVNNPQLIFIGCTGNLAKKYIWSSLSVLHYNFKSIVCGSRESEDIIEKNLKNITSNLLNFDNHIYKIVKPIKLKEISDYDKLSTILDVKYPIIVYFCVPPQAYSDLTKNLLFLFKKIEVKKYILFLYEKPLSITYNDAFKLKELLSSSATVTSYSFDHYLYKMNYDLKSINNFPIKSINEIESISMIIYEELTVENRLSFYNSVGVIGDVMQNHMTEVIIEIISKYTQIKRKDVIEKIYDLKCYNFGKYESDKDKLTVPTFAECDFSINLENRIIPIHFTSGKGLNITESSVKINNQFAIYLSGKSTGKWCKEGICYYYNNKGGSNYEGNNSYVKLFSSILRLDYGGLVELDESMILWKMWDKYNVNNINNYGYKIYNSSNWL